MPAKKTQQESTLKFPSLPAWVEDLTGDLKPDGGYSYIRKKFDVKNEQDAGIMRAKAAIAYYVANELIKDTGNVFFDAGSTLKMIARATFIRANRENLNLVVTTNNMDIFEDFLSSGCKYSLDQNKCDVSLQLTGGKYDRQHHALFGLLAAETLNEVYPEAIIMGVTGFRFEDGLFYHGATEESSIKTALYTKGVCRRILVCDHSKMGGRDVFLCRNDSKHAIEGLCSNVTEKTIIVTSKPDGDEPWAEDRRSQVSRILSDGIESERVRAFVRQGKLDVVVVEPSDKPCHYSVQQLL
jgi:DeoR/GlpR family transcriptional regulator of sugar metabolism